MELIELKDRIKKIPKAELHRHIEGCVKPPTIIRIARREGLTLPTFDEKKLATMVSLQRPMNSLAQVLKCFEIAQSVFVSYEAVEEIVSEAIEDAYGNENIRLMELRYSPDFMLKGKDLDWQKTFEVIQSTVRTFEKKHSFFGGIIIIASRCYQMDSILKTVDFAVRNKHLIAGFDFADDEINHPPSLYKSAARKLHEASIPLTVHSGEEGSFTQVLETIRLLNPKRIGHGVKAVNDPSGETLRLIRERNITIESNPYSNYLTHAVDSIENHPLKKFIEAGISVAIGADDPEVLNTNLNKEYLLAVEKIGLSMEDIAFTNKCALAGSFLEKDAKQEASKFFNDR